MLGSFDGTMSTQALGDPTDPLHYCLGFNQAGLVEGTISADGRFIYGIDGDMSIRAMVTEDLKQELAPDGKLQWVYPFFASANDTVIFTSTLQGCGVGLFKLLPPTTSIYYTCPGRIINSERGDPPYDIGTTNVNTLLTVLPDGALLVYTFEQGIKIVSASRIESLIAMPKSIPVPVCQAARQFVDGVTGERKVWVQCFDYNYYGSQDENQNRRFTVNTITNTIVDDGVFSTAPAGTKPILEGKFDADGNLWQVGTMINDPTIHVVIKRPISGGVSSLVYSEANYIGTGNWKKDAIPFLRPSTVLISGS
jgi:hypothetical protein